MSVKFHYRYTDIPVNRCLLEGTRKDVWTVVYSLKPHTHIIMSGRTDHTRIVHGLCAGIRRRSRTRVKKVNETKISIKSMVIHAVSFYVLGLWGFSRHLLVEYTVNPPVISAEKQPLISYRKSTLYFYWSLAGVRVSFRAASLREVNLVRTEVRQCNTA